MQMISFGQPQHFSLTKMGSFLDSGTPGITRVDGSISAETVSLTKTIYDRTNSQFRAV